MIDDTLFCFCDCVESRRSSVSFPSPVYFSYDFKNERRAIEGVECRIAEHKSRIEARDRAREASQKLRLEQEQMMQRRKERELADKKKEEEKEQENLRR